MTVKTAFIFPGQGTQAVGMGADLAHDFSAAKAVFEQVDEALHQNLSQLMFQGDIQELTQTQNAQPAIMAVSMAIFSVLKTEGCPMPDAVAGHSLGEYSALCAADVITLTQAAQLLKFRGQAMARACLKNKGGMMALLGASLEQAQQLAQDSGCYVANENAVGQVVLSGTIENLNKASELASKMSIKRVVLLPVDGAFHSPLMQEAAEEMTMILKATAFQVPKCAVYFNVTADLDPNPTHYADLLTKQITAPVRWCELVQNMKATSFVECGYGSVLSGLVRRIVPEAQIETLNTSAVVKNYLKNV